MGQLADILMWKGLVRSHLPEGAFNDEVSKDRISSMMELGFTPEQTVNVLMSNDKPKLDIADWQTKRMRGKS